MNHDVQAPPPVGDADGWAYSEVDPTSHRLCFSHEKCDRVVDRTFEKIQRQMKCNLLVLALILLTGCASYQDRPLASSATVAQLTSRSLENSGLRQFIETNRKQYLPQWPLKQWNFADLTLAAFYFHPDLDVARAQWAVARAGEVTAGERPNPSIGISPTYNSTTAIPSPWIVTLTGDIPIETAGKRGDRLAQARHLSEVARLHVASVAWQVRSRVRNSVLELEAANELASLLTQQQSIQAENLRLLKLQHDAGAISAFELTQAQLAADDSRLALRDAEQKQTEARAKLAGAIGIPASALNGVELVFDVLDFPLSGPPEVRQLAMVNRADVLGALAEYAASQSALQLEIAKQYPDVHLGPGYEYDQGDNKWSLGLSVTLPVFNQNQGAIAEAEARRTEAAARFNALQAQVLSEVDAAEAAFKGATRKWQDAKQMLDDVTKQEKSAEAMLAAGEISKSDLIAIQLQLGASKLARQDAMVKFRQAAGQLEDAIQLPLDLPATAWQSSPRSTEIQSATADAR